MISFLYFVLFTLPYHLFWIGVSFGQWMFQNYIINYFKTVTFKDKVIWITGASSGIGKEMAMQMSSLGAKMLILSSRNETELVGVKYQCEHPDKVQIVQMDMGDPEKVLKITADYIKKLEDQNLKLDIIVLNAGVTMRSTFEDFHFENHQYMTRVNYISPTAQIHVLIPHLKKNPESQIVVINSILGKMTQPLRSSYCGSKYGLLGFIDVLRSELSHYKIYVTSLYPGLTQTNVQKNALVSEKGKVYGKSDKTLLTGMPVKEFVERGLRAIYFKENDAIISHKFIHYFIMSCKNIYTDYFHKMNKKELKTQLQMNEKPV